MTVFLEGAVENKLGDCPHAVAPIPPVVVCVKYSIT